jgi:hypothetical protein
VNGDHVPEIAIGRLPVISPEELNTMIKKIRTYESTINKKVILLADFPDDGGDFIADSDAIASLFPAGYGINKIYLHDTSQADTDAVRSALFAAINNGAFYFNYVGHAGPDQLSNEGILTTDDLSSLTNAFGLPMMTAMTCVLGNFSDPFEVILSEALLLKGDGGVAAVWSPTGLSDDSQAKILDREFYNAIFLGRRKTVGDAVKQAFAEYAAQGSMPFMIDIYNILGDPALKIR